MKEFAAAIKMNLLFIVVTGLFFPALIWGLSQLLFPYQANGSLRYDQSGKLIGSEIIGQQFTLPKYFHPRPSAAGSGYDGANSSGTNLGPTSSKLIEGIKDDPKTSDADESYNGVGDFADAYRNENGLSKDFPVPVDAVTRSASGLDPDISPANALIQAKRVAKERSMRLADVEQLVHDAIKGRFLGIYGEARVNVFELNRQLDGLKK